MKSSIRISAFTVGALAILSFLAGVANGLAGDPTRPHDVLLTIEFAALFVAAYLPAESPEVGARARRWAAVALGGGAGAVGLLLGTEILRLLFVDAATGTARSSPAALLVGLKTGTFLLCMAVARAVCLVVLREGVPATVEAPEQHGVAEEKHA
jgi:hypothetical protein